MAESLGEKTEAPTPKKLFETRRKGQVAKSQDFAGAVQLIGAVLILLMFLPSLSKSAIMLMERTLGTLGPGATELDATLHDSSVASGYILLAIAPVMGAVFFVAFLSQFLQVGYLVSLHPIKPKFNQVNPWTGAKRLVSKRSLVKSLVNIAKLAIVASVAVAVMMVRERELYNISRLEIIGALLFIGRVMLELCAWMLAALLVLGLIDLAYQRWQHTQDLKMTKHEVKDERKSMDGDPEVKARRRRLAQQIASQQVQRDVPKADVVVTNPTHYAVALRYDADTMDAPTVVAKGVDSMAMRIREVARAHAVPIVEKPALARALHASAEPGQQISPELYEAVAEVLAYVYRMNAVAA